MIDTDKYEGHTPAPWMKDGNNICDTYGNVVLRYHYTVTTANHTLIADTPLLLAEVKRLQKYERFFQHMDDIHHTHGLLEECWETEVLKVIGEEE